MMNSLPPSVGKLYSMTPVVFTRTWRMSRDSGTKVGAVMRWMLDKKYLENLLINSRKYLFVTIFEEQITQYCSSSENPHLCYRSRMRKVKKTLRLFRSSGLVSRPCPSPSLQLPSLFDCIEFNKIFAIFQSFPFIGFEPFNVKFLTCNSPEGCTHFFD